MWMRVGYDGDGEGMGDVGRNVDGGVWIGIGAEVKLRERERE